MTYHEPKKLSKQDREIEKQIAEEKRRHISYVRWKLRRKPKLSLVERDVADGTITGDKVSLRVNSKGDVQVR